MSIKRLKNQTKCQLKDQKMVKFDRKSQKLSTFQLISNIFDRIGPFSIYFNFFNQNQLSIGFVLIDFVATSKNMAINLGQKFDSNLI